MDTSVSGQSKWAGPRAVWEKVCILAFVCALFSVSDGLISAVRQPANHLALVPGRAIPLTGQVYGKAITAEDLTISTGIPGLEFRLEKSLYKGFWLGGAMWRGQLSAAAALAPGTYGMTVDYRDLSEIRPEDLDKVRALCTYTVRVHASALALRQADLSLIRRHTGLSPWPMALAFFVVIVLSGTAVFILSGRVDQEMAGQGMAVIYRVSPMAAGAEVFFGLGRSHGLETGDRLQVLSGTGGKLGEITALDIGPENSRAVADIPGILPGSIVAKIHSF